MAAIDAKENVGAVKNVLPGVCTLVDEANEKAGKDNCALLVVSGSDAPNERSLTAAVEVGFRSVLLPEVTPNKLDRVSGLEEFPPRKKEDAGMALAPDSFSVLVLVKTISPADSVGDAACPPNETIGPFSDAVAVLPRE